MTSNSLLLLSTLHQFTGLSKLEPSCSPTGRVFFSSLESSSLSSSSWIPREAPWIDPSRFHGPKTIEDEIDHRRRRREVQETLALRNYLQLKRIYIHFILSNSGCVKFIGQSTQQSKSQHRALAERRVDHTGPWLLINKGYENSKKKSCVVSVVRELCHDRPLQLKTWLLFFDFLWLDSAWPVSGHPM